ncbi:hypothetical protein K458DRAFT_80052 [Lentithecium fluviatile CBS 122367]|uniref:Uncharacterized protein n=1 Tax=Lentithecium fluviatile CBS 122367 TaxID=1168545 RepID=A0A6G1ITW4_9PLEO|nr:hypothetical protein K458DRAFT_80052 [Lentithecium fluviatile CBS 122367]
MMRLKALQTYLGSSFAFIGSVSSLRDIHDEKDEPHDDPGQHNYRKHYGAKEVDSLPCRSFWVTCKVVDVIDWIMRIGCMVRCVADNGCVPLARDFATDLMESHIETGNISENCVQCAYYERKDKN